MSVQPVPRPSTVDEFEAVRHLLVDTLGRPLVSEHCGRCGSSHYTVEPHLDEVPCPQCSSAGKRCVRPSEHEATSWHRARVEAFDALRDAQEAAGRAQVARWP